MLLPLSPGGTQGVLVPLGVPWGIPLSILLLLYFVLVARGVAFKSSPQQRPSIALARPWHGLWALGEFENGFG